MQEQRQAVEDALTKSQVDQWIRSEVDRYLASVSRSGEAEERRAAVARAKAGASGPHDLLTVREAAAILKVHPITVRKYVRLGILQGRKVISRILIPRASLMKVIEALPVEPMRGGA
jgi:excisionase family DNA binding protein